VLGDSCSYFLHSVPQAQKRSPIRKLSALCEVTRLRSRRDLRLFTDKYEEELCVSGSRAKPAVVYVLLPGIQVCCFGNHGKFLVKSKTHSVEVHIM